MSSGGAEIEETLYANTTSKSVNRLVGEVSTSTMSLAGLTVWGHYSVFGIEGGGSSSGPANTNCSGSISMTIKI